MITRLRLKNWRSLRDVTIDDLQPINVFIGANASGKTNILDALYFTREMIISRDIMSAVYKRGWGRKILTLGIDINEPIGIELTCQLSERAKPLTWATEIMFSEPAYKFQVKRALLEESRIVFEHPFEDPAIDDVELPTPSYTSVNYDVDGRQLLSDFRSYIITRWQLLGENFHPPLNMSTSNAGRILLIDQFAENLVFMLDFMQQTRPDIYDQLQSDLSYLVGHVKSVQASRDDRETRILFYELNYPDVEAPTVSAGTARILAMLTAYYALDMRNASQPGLVVVEEPDTALNPSVLRNFVEMLREYVKRPEPRQFILTTHNPTFLNYFNPEEVRIVSRDEQGYTTVDRVPDYIKDIWLDEYDLGEVWLTNAFGGMRK